MEKYLVEPGSTAFYAGAPATELPRRFDERQSANIFHLFLYLAYMLTTDTIQSQVNFRNHEEGAQYAN